MAKRTRIWVWFTSPGYVEWTVTSQVTRGANHAFLIRDGSENGSGFEQSFHSREKAPDNPPQLVHIR